MARAVDTDAPPPPSVETGGGSSHLAPASRMQGPTSGKHIIAHPALLSLMMGVSFTAAWLIDNLAQRLRTAQRKQSPGALASHAGRTASIKRSITASRSRHGGSLTVALLLLLGSCHASSAAELNEDARDRVGEPASTTTSRASRSSPLPSAAFASLASAAKLAAARGNINSEATPQPQPADQPANWDGDHGAPETVSDSAFFARAVPTPFPSPTPIPSEDYYSEVSANDILHSTQPEDLRWTARSSSKPWSASAPLPMARRALDASPSPMGGGVLIDCSMQMYYCGLPAGDSDAWQCMPFGCCNDPSFPYLTTIHGAMNICYSHESYALGEGSPGCGSWCSTDGMTACGGVLPPPNLCQNSFATSAGYYSSNSNAQSPSPPDSNSDDGSTHRELGSGDACSQSCSCHSVPTSPDYFGRFGTSLLPFFLSPGVTLSEGCHNFGACAA